MRPTHLITAAAMTLLALVAVPAHAATAAAGVTAAELREQWVVQARAADAIGEVVTAAAERAEAQVDLLRRELAEAGGKRHAATGPATSQPPPAARGEPSAFAMLVDRVIAEARRLGAGEVDPSLQNLPDAQLFNEMAALQSYNLRTFRRLEVLRAQASGMREQLESIGRWKAEATTRPAIETPDELARQAVVALKRPQASPRWAEARQKLRNALAVARMRQLREIASRAAAPPAPSPIPPPADRAYVDDPRWQPYYYGPADRYSGWTHDMFDDGFDFRGGGGVYERYDTRVNADFDTRTHGQSDRRVNVNSDRRLNVHHDPRENF